MTQPANGTIVKCAICGVDTMVFEPKKKHCPTCANLPGEAFKAAAQLRKAIKLSTTLTMCGGNAWDINTLPLRRLTEKVAGVPESSDVTWALVGVLMQGGAE